MRLWLGGNGGGGQGERAGAHLPEEAVICLGVDGLADARRARRARPGRTRRGALGHGHARQVDPRAAAARAQRRRAVPLLAWLAALPARALRRRLGLLQPLQLLPRDGVVAAALAASAAPRLRARALALRGGLGLSGAPARYGRRRGRGNVLRRQRDRVEHGDRFEHLLGRGGRRGQRWRRVVDFFGRRLLLRTLLRLRRVRLPNRRFPLHAEDSHSAPPSRLCRVRHRVAESTGN